MNNKEKSSAEWLFEITPKNKFFSLNLKEVWQYRDLLMLFVKRAAVGDANKPVWNLSERNGLIIKN